MAKASINQVAEELLKQARADKIKWEVIDDRETAFRTSFPETSLIVSRWSPMHNAPWAEVRALANSISLDLATYRLELLNDSGEVLESLLTLPGQAAYRHLREVYQLAHGQASYAEKNINEVLQNLRQA